MSKRELVINIIDKYRELPCLWQKTNKDYYNKHKRNKALDEILKIFKTQFLDANRDSVQNKLASMRTCFKKEFNKVQTSLRYAAGIDEVYIPKLWYYEHLLFLKDVEAPRPSQSVHTISNLFDEHVDDSDNTQIDELSNTESHIENMPQPSQSSSSPREPFSLLSSYKRTKTRADADLSKISDRLDTQKQSKNIKEKYSAYGEHVAEKLRGMTDAMAIHCQKQMNDAIYMAELESLDCTSHIVTDSRLIDETTVHQQASPVDDIEPDPKVPDRSTQELYKLYCEAAVKQND